WPWAAMGANVHCTRPEPGGRRPSGAPLGASVDSVWRGLERLMQIDDAQTVERLRQTLGRRSIVLVGLMGCGKSSVGKRLANRLGLNFIDADEEIERVAQKSINEIFAD